MRKTIIGGVCGVLLLAVGLPAMAGDKEDVEARIEQHYQFWNQKKGEEWVSTYYTPGFTFAAPNGFFGEPETIEDVRANIPNNNWDSPNVRFNYNPRYINVAIYGNGTVAVAHYYRMGSTTNKDGVTTPISLRASDVWVKVKDGGKDVWKLAHRHLSPLTVGTPPPPR